MLDAAQKAVAFTEDRTRDDLDPDEMLTLAIVRLLEIIGEASKNVSDSLKAASPEIPWQQIAGTRNRLIHGYFDVDLDIIWQIISVDLPPLISRLAELIDSLQS